MRKIEQILKRHWEAGTPIRISNSEVKVAEDGSVSLHLFRNCIAFKVARAAIPRFTLAEHNTLTTRSRLKNVLGLNIYSRAGVARVYSSSRAGEIAIFNHEWYYTNGCLWWEGYRTVVHAAPESREEILRSVPPTRHISLE